MYGRHNWITETVAESFSFIILTDNEEIGEDDGESFRMGGM